MVILREFEAQSALFIDFIEEEISMVFFPTLKVSLPT